MHAARTSAQSIRWRRILIDPMRLWARHTPTLWPGPATHWTDLGRLAPGSSAEVDGVTIDVADHLESLEGTVWLPPAAPAFTRARTTMLETLRDRGVPILDQRMPGDDAPVVSEPLIFDLFEALLVDDPASMARLPAGAWALWPLIPGVTDEPERLERGFEALRRADVAGVHGVALELGPRQRRELAAFRGESAFDALFHGASSSERAFAAAAHRSGLEVFLPRPLPRVPRLARNRRLAELLFSVGDLWRRLDRHAAQREDFLAAARRLDEIEQDMELLIREGNLSIVDWLPPQAKALLEGFTADGETPQLLRDLRREYLEGAS